MTCWVERLQWDEAGTELIGASASVDEGQTYGGDVRVVPSVPSGKLLWKSKHNSSLPCGRACMWKFRGAFDIKVNTAADLSWHLSSEHTAVVLRIFWLTGGPSWQGGGSWGLQGYREHSALMDEGKAFLLDMGMLLGLYPTLHLGATCNSTVLRGSIVRNQRWCLQQCTRHREHILEGIFLISFPP